MSCFISFVITLVLTISFLILSRAYQKAQNNADQKENKSKSTDYVYKRNEIASEIGGTNLDRFFIECTLSRCNDFTTSKNVAKAKLFADKYNLSYTNDAEIEALYNQALKAHEKITDKIMTEKLDKQRQKEQKEYNCLIKYAEYYGRDKKKAILTDRMNELRNKADLLDHTANTLIKSGQQRERDWATWGGIADGIAGVGAGVSTAIDIQIQNAQIRAQNEANMRSAMPSFMTLTGNASQNRSNANKIQKQIESLSEKLVSDLSAPEVMKLLEIINPTIDVSETGAYVVTATVIAKNKLFIFDDVPAVADGTIEAHVLDGTREIGTAKMVLPVDGVSEKTGIIGMGLSGAEFGKSYNITFSDYKLWLMEK